LERAYADARERVAHVAFGRFAEVVALREVEVGVQRLEARDERAAQARIVERFAVVALAVAPVLEPADDDGAIDQVDHRPRPEGRDELALPELPFGSRDALLLLEAGHQVLSSRWAKRSHTGTLGSTSRMLVGASNCRAS